MPRFALLCSTMMSALLLAGCGGGGSGDTASAASTAPPTSAATSNPPTISGTPSTTATVGTAYDFTPTASDPNGQALTFSATNVPIWATFSQTTGALTGTPPSAGTFANIVISVSDGVQSASLPAFSISVTAPVATTGSAQVSWSPPTTNVDGTPLTNLAGFNIHYGNSGSALTQTVQVSNPAAVSYVLTNLAKGTWYFAVTAYTSDGAESLPSAVASKTI